MRITDILFAFAVWVAIELLIHWLEKWAEQ
jgi:hypothetical protein